MDEKAYVLLPRASSMASAHAEAILNCPDLECHFDDVHAPNPCP